MYVIKIDAFLKLPRWKKKLPAWLENQEKVLSKFSGWKKVFKAPWLENQEKECFFVTWGAIIIRRKKFFSKLIARFPLAY